MSTAHYQRLNITNDVSWLFNKKLQAFAITYRLQRASNYLHVASQIIERNLIDAFIKFVPPEPDDKTAAMKFHK